MARRVPSRARRIRLAPRVRAEYAHLFRASLDNARMTMPDMRNIVVRVDVCSAFGVVEILHPSTHDFDRILVRNAEIVTDVCAPVRERLALRGYRCRKP